MSSFLTVLILLIIGFVFGRMNEARHFARLKRDEAELSDILTVNLKTFPEDLQDNGILVAGNVVVAVDYFKKIVAGLKTLIGGRLRSYESLLERARREAIIRMKKQARELGADAIYNVRLEFAATGQQPGNVVGGVEIYAYGTAVRRL